MSDQLFQLGLIAYVFAASAFFAGGLMKGVVGVGLPLVVVPVLSLAVDPRLAISVMMIPILASNFLQAIRGRDRLATLRRFLPLILTLMPTTFLGTYMLVSITAESVALILGFLVILYCVMELVPLSFHLPERFEKPATPAVGLIAGAVGGVSSFYGPTIFMYLNALRLHKDDFVTAIGMIYVSGAAALYGGLALHGVLDAGAVLASLAASLPVLLGLLAGRRLRHHISQRNFERLLLAILFVIGLTLITRGINGMN